MRTKGDKQLSYQSVIMSLRQLHERVSGERAARLFFIPIFLLGLLIRVPLAVRNAPSALAPLFEPVNIAISLVQNGTYANAYGKFSGPSAHCLPGHPLLIATLIAVFGTGHAGAIALAIVACTAMAMTFALLPALSTCCRFGPLPGILAGVAGALIPVNFWAQTTGLFDQPFSALILVISLCLVARMWNGEAVRPVWLGLVFGAGCLLNALFLTVFVVLAALSWKRQWVTWITAAAVLSLVMSPWVARNYLTFHQLILTRSNFGLEVAVSNNQYVGADLDRNLIVIDQLGLHPTTSDYQRQLVRQMGEPAYSGMRMHGAFQWIKSNPLSFVRLAVMRLWDLAFPRMLRSWQTAVEAAITLMAIVGLLFPFKMRTMFIGAILGYYWVFLLVQASARYRLPLEPLMLLIGAQAAVSLRLQAKRRVTASVDMAAEGRAA